MAVRSEASLIPHIGIVGVSPEGSALCIRSISREASRRLKPSEQPRLSLHNEPLPMYINAIRQGDWPAVASLLRLSAEKLASLGAEFCVTPDHAVQYALDLASHESVIPWVGIPELLGNTIIQDGRKKVGLIGTKWVTAASTYQTYLGIKGIQVHAPAEQDAEILDRIIINELVFGQVTASSLEAVARIIRGLAERGCEAIILGSSEAPLIINEQTCQLPVYDAGQILAKGVIDRAIRAGAGVLES